MKLLVDRFPIKSVGDYDIVPVRAGYQHCQPGYHWGPQLRDSWTIHYVFSGCGTVVKDGKKFIVHKNEVFILQPGETIELTADIHNPWVYIWVGFRSKIDIPKIFYEQDHFLCRELENLFLEIANCNSSANRPLEPLLVSYIWKLIFWMEKLSNPSNKGYTASEMYVQRALQFIHNNYANFSVDILTNELHLSRNHISRIFKATMGMTLQDYHTDIRMREARKLLLNGYNVSHTAILTGYSDIASFSRAYKKYYKFTPREYLQINSSRPLDDDATEALQEIEDQGEFFVNSNIQT